MRKTFWLGTLVVAVCLAAVILWWRYNQSSALYQLIWRVQTAGWK